MRLLPHVHSFECRGFSSWYCQGCEKTVIGAGEACKLEEESAANCGFAMIGWVAAVIACCFILPYLWNWSWG